VGLGTAPDAAARAVAERAAAAEVVYLGEAHDNPHHHAGQVAVLRATVARGARPAVAFEMLPETDQAVVDEALAGDAPSEEVGRRIGWAVRGWPDFAMYWPLFDEARRHRLPVLAADLAPATTRQIARHGLATLGAGAARLASALPPDAAREGAIARTIRDAHCDLLPATRLPAMVESWHARNVTIARRIAGALDRAADGAGGRPGPRTLVIIGAGHQMAGGVPDQLAALRPGTRQLVVRFAEVAPGAPPEAAPADPVAGPADVVWLTPGPRRDDPCAAMRRRLPS
jgi:uncharacterized iron-regulated protein